MKPVSPGGPGRVSSIAVVDLPFACVPSLADQLAGVMDIEGKIPRALEALGPLAGSAVAVLDIPGTPWLDRLRAGGTQPVVVTPPPDGDPIRNTE